jgi:hypothetical protein
VKWRQTSREMSGRDKKDTVNQRVICQQITQSRTDVQNNWAIFSFVVIKPPQKIHFQVALKLLMILIDSDTGLGHMKYYY